jgi:phospholipid transport system substrate-binding protein
MRYDIPSIGRRGLLGLGIAAIAAAPVWHATVAEAEGGASPSAPVDQLVGALLAAMKAGDRMSFEERYRALEPVIAQVFDLDAILAASVGLSWATMTDAQKAELATAFRRYTVSSYVSNFDSYNGQSFRILPTQRVITTGEVVVATQLVRPGKSPIELDYVMRQGPTGWRVVDVLSDGTISRVAVQRSDFRSLLRSGGVSALTKGLTRTVANLSGGMVG